MAYPMPTFESRIYFKERQRRFRRFEGGLSLTAFTLFLLAFVSSLWFITSRITISFLTIAVILTIVLNIVVTLRNRLYTRQLDHRMFASSQSFWEVTFYTVPLVLVNTLVIVGIFRAIIIVVPPSSVLLGLFILVVFGFILVLSIVLIHCLNFMQPRNAWLLRSLEDAYPNWNTDLRKTAARLLRPLQKAKATQEFVKQLSYLANGDDKFESEIRLILESEKLNPPSELVLRSIEFLTALIGLFIMIYEIVKALTL